MLIAILVLVSLHLVVTAAHMYLDLRRVLPNNWLAEQHAAELKAFVVAGKLPGAPPIAASMGVEAQARLHELHAADARVAVAAAGQHPFAKKDTANLDRVRYATQFMLDTHPEMPAARARALVEAAVAEAKSSK